MSDHVQGRWCADLHCSRCYSAATWQDSELERVRAYAVAFAQKLAECGPVEHSADEDIGLPAGIICQSCCTWAKPDGTIEHDEGCIIPKVDEFFRANPPAPALRYCDLCDGTGTYEGGAQILTKCEECEGTGTVEGEVRGGAPSDKCVHETDRHIPEAVRLLQEWIDTETDPEDGDEYVEWMESFTARAMAVIDASRHQSGKKPTHLCLEHGEHFGQCPKCVHQVNHQPPSKCSRCGYSPVLCSACGEPHICRGTKEANYRAALEAINRLVPAFATLDNARSIAGDALGLDSQSVAGKKP